MKKSCQQRCRLPSLVSSMAPAATVCKASRLLTAAVMRTWATTRTLSVLFASNREARRGHGREGQSVVDAADDARIPPARRGRRDVCLERGLPARGREDHRVVGPARRAVPPGLEAQADPLPGAAARHAVRGLIPD